MNLYADMDLSIVLAALISDGCRARTQVSDGQLSYECEGEASIVTLACEHEHFFDVRLCNEHSSKTSEGPRPCPCCCDAERARHRCRLAVVGGAR